MGTAMMARQRGRGGCPKVLKEWVLVTFDLRTDREELELVTRQFQEAHVSWLKLKKKYQRCDVLYFVP